MLAVLSNDFSSTEVLTEPKPEFGLGELPVEYTPLNSETLKSGDQFGPLPFKISSLSHKHHLEYISRCNTAFLDNVTPYLYPFEFWPLPRVMSQCRFGRLNEVISIRADRIIRKRPEAEQRLIGETRVKSISDRNGLCFGFFESITRTTTGGICMIAEDVLLLGNGCDSEKLHQAVLRSKENQVNRYVDTPSAILGSWNLQMRYPWPEDKWLNNIHTDIYARRLGYNCGLVEGPGVADVVLSTDEISRQATRAFRLSWKYTGPLYHGTAVALVSEIQNNYQCRQYHVCELPNKLPSKCRILVNVEVEYL